MRGTTEPPALREVELLLEREGMHEALAELRRTIAAAEAAAASAQAIAGVTRALLENEKTYRLVFSHELDPVSLFDTTTGRFLDVNDAWVRLYGYTREEALTMVATDVRAEPATTANAIELTPAAAAEVDIRWHRSKDGTVFPVELKAGRITLGGREVMYATMRDITERQRAEGALARSEASYRALIESMPDAVIVHRLGKIVYVNPAARRMHGYEPEDDLVGVAILDLVDPDERELATQRVQRVMMRGEVAAPREARFIRKDGTSLVAEVSAHSTVFDGESAVIAIARDVTVRRRLEAQLVMNDRLASIGRVVASVGHELNNPLAYVLGNISMMERELSRNVDLSPSVLERLTRHLALAKEGAGRMRNIVNDMKTLARGEGHPRVPIDVQNLLDVCVNMAEHELQARAELVKEYRDKVFVCGTEARMGQVFLNLLVNAAQAIQEGNASTNQVRIVVAALDGARALVEIHDTGAGILPEHADRVFDPFFTTKLGRGTGLGLSVAHTIVSSEGGTIAIESRPAGGTVFASSSLP